MQADDEKLAINELGLMKIRLCENLTSAFTGENILIYSICITLPLILAA